MPLGVRLRLTLWYTAILLGILVVISGLSYSLLRWSLVQDLDISLRAVGQVIRDTGWSGPGGTSAEALLRDLLGPEFHDKFFQLVDPEGRPGAHSAQLRDRLPLSPRAHRRAAAGDETYETVHLAAGARVRLLTMPVDRGGRLVRLIQVGMPLDRAERALGRYLETLLVLIPLGVGLAAAGGAVVARRALKPVDEMSRTARRITGEELGRRIRVRGTGDELDHLAGTLNAMLARLEEAFTQVRRFAADAAHELRTPLTALKGGIEVALRTERPREEYRRVLVSSLEEVERLVRLAEDLLLLSRFSAGALPARERVELQPLLHDLREVGERLALARGVRVDLVVDAPLAVHGDPATLRRAVLNLVENAIKYTPPGGRVELGLAPADRSAAIVVRDTGVGMDPAEAARVFEPFVRLDEARARDTGGAGLGLAIVRSIVLAHGGTLAVESAPGAGSTFTIRLPLA
ncbi:MAG: HAMP domain-containing protein [Candidatus Rokubacteria bacterium]|nr:HAMP domain-containing protein [Candidatus Rokubacteria bacterium]